MTQLPSLAKLKEYFPFHRICVVKNLILLMNCILHSKSVNLNSCKLSAPILLNDKDLNVKNIYARFVRFFKIEEISVFCLCIAQMCVDSLREIQDNTYIIVDRTNWKLGTLNRNILQVGITLSNGLLIPIFGVPLDKRGNSNESERIKLLDIILRLCTFLRKGDILLADREFIGKDWFTHILNCTLSFVIRLRKDDYLAQVAIGAGTTVDKLSRKIKRKIKANGFFFTTIELGGKQLYYLVVKDTKKTSNSKDGYVRLLSDLSDIQAIIKAYQHRWQIEIYFAKTKRKGFNLEDINLKSLEKVMLMATIVGYLYTLCLLQGMEEEIEEPQALQFFLERGKSYKKVSIFKRGLEAMKASIFNMADLIEWINQKIKTPTLKMKIFLSQYLDKSIIDEVKSV